MCGYYNHSYSVVYPSRMALAIRSIHFASQAMPASKENQFCLFGLLPLEIRRIIYILATPPRVVHVTEDGHDTDDWHRRYDEFAKACRDMSVHFKLHPDIAYFAHNWLARIGWSLSQRGHRQTTLDSYGFTSTRKRYSPWVATEHLPEIPSLWLLDHPREAWAMTRSASLTANAPIPALLHVCSESREVLQSYGYQLAFGTRTHEPRTWFHFKRDTLYIDYGEPGEQRLLSGGSWDVGQFRPADLRRVEKLALNGGLWALFSQVDQTLNLLRLLPNVQELSLVEWDPYVVNDWIEGNSHHKLPQPQPEDEHGGGPGEHYVCVPVDEIDFITDMRPYRWHDASHCWTVYYRVKGHKKDDGLKPHMSYFEYAAWSFEQYLHSKRREHPTTNSSTTAASYNIPKVTITHMCALSKTRHIFAMRRYFWTQFLDTKARAEAKGQAAGEAGPGAQPSRDERSAFYRLDREDTPERKEFTFPLTPGELWWIKKARVFPPQFEII
ncbi:hypothetical protein F5B20DRAFT_540890 [Whalleya microplaca]|nr:hypothetical protein F5B20DRAFT_540890 [Whalleya microplaca]